MKNYIGFSRDHSGSMTGITRAAAKDYNDNILAIKQAAADQGIDTIVTVVKCGVGRPATNIFETVNSNVTTLKPLAESAYEATGTSTPLFDSVGMIIDTFERLPDANDPTVAFLVMVTTDGDNNDVREWTATRISQKIRQLQQTDRWTFVFRVPRGRKTALVRMGIPEGNIQEWEQTDTGVKQSSAATASAFTGYYTARSAGKTSTQKFYETDMSNIKPAEVKQKLHEINPVQVKFWNVPPKDDGTQIRVFCENKLGGKTMARGGAFYELTKPEREVHDHKQIVIRDRNTAKLYTGTGARQLLGLPTHGTVKVVPGDHSNYEIFIQSTSVNRKLVAGTQVLYWESVGVPYAN